MSEATGYLRNWEADVVLSDGGTVHPRPIHPDDGPGLVALHGRMSERPATGQRGPCSGLQAGGEGRLGEVSSVVLQQALVDLNTAYRCPDTGAPNR